MANFIVGMISLTIGVVVLANVFITTVKGTNTAGTCTQTVGTANYTCSPLVNATMVGTWTSAEVALWSLLTIAGIAGIVYGVLNTFGLA